MVSQVALLYQRNLSPESFAGYHYYCCTAVLLSCPVRPGTEKQQILDAGVSGEQFVVCAPWSESVHTQFCQRAAVGSVRMRARWGCSLLSCDDAAAATPPRQRARQLPAVGTAVLTVPSMPRLASVLYVGRHLGWRRNSSSGSVQQQ